MNVLAPWNNRFATFRSNEQAQFQLQLEESLTNRFMCSASWWCREISKQNTQYCFNWFCLEFFNAETFQNQAKSPKSFNRLHIQTKLHGDIEWIFFVWPNWDLKWWERKLSTLNQVNIVIFCLHSNKLFGAPLELNVCAFWALHCSSDIYSNVVGFATQTKQHIQNNSSQIIELCSRRCGGSILCIGNYAFNRQYNKIFE